MSTWNLGIDDVSEETRAFKDKISSKDAQIAAQQDRLYKQANDLEELKERLNDALHKFTAETQRALQLEVDLNQRTEELRDERIASENAKAAFVASQEKNKDSNMELRQLEGTLERISHTSDEHKARADKLQRDKSVLETRIRELESILRDPTPPNTTATPGRRGASRPRSSSLSNFRITTLEQDLLEVRASLAKKETDLQVVSQKLAQVHKDLMKADNDKAAMERKLSSEVETLRASLEEREEELSYLKEEQADGLGGDREDELLRRIEEDDAKIAALELMLGGDEGCRELKETLRRVESQLEDERRSQAEVQHLYTELTREKGEILENLQKARQELQQMKVRENMLKEKAAKSLETCDDPPMNDDSCLLDMDTPEPSSLPTHPNQLAPSNQEKDIDAVTQIERLLSAIERLRGERDGLRRDVQFLETESRFAIEALEAKLSASVSTNNNTQTLATIDELRAEMDDLHAQLLASNNKSAVTIAEKNLQIKNLSVKVQALAVTLEHVSSNADIPGSPRSTDRRQSQHDGTTRGLEHNAHQRDGFLSQTQSWDTDLGLELESTRQAEQEAREHLEEAMHEIAELNNHIDAVESERDSLTLQLTNLTTDLQIAQGELTNAETRYTNLQFHQLNTMTSNEATRTLREHIEELEGRVMRRNELVGVLQHDVRRLDTNLRLQEERLMEMTSELEMMSAQKDAMVEDCADAREARDEALLHIEALEDDLENTEARKRALEEEKAVLEKEKAILEKKKVALQGENAEKHAAINSLIVVIQDCVHSVQETVRRVKDQAVNPTDDLSSTQQKNSDQLQQLRAKISNLIGITKQTEEYSDGLEKVEVDLDQCNAEFQELSVLVQNLHREQTTTEVKVNGLEEQDRESEIEDLKVKNKELQNRIQQLNSIGSSDGEAGQTLVHFKLQHAEAIGDLQKRLVEAESVVEELQTRYAAAQCERERSQDDSNKVIDKLQQQLDKSTKDLSEFQELRQKLVTVQKDQEVKAAELAEQLTAAVQLQKDALESRDSLQLRNEALLADIQRLRQELDTLFGSQGDKLAVQQDLERKVQSFQGRFEEESRLLEISREEAARLELRLQEEVQGRAQDLESHQSELEDVKEQYARSEGTVAMLQDNLAALQKELQDGQANMTCLEEEKILLQQEITTLEAENQKSKSLSRYLEAQVKDSDTLISTLKTDTGRLQSDIARLEKSCKTAEVNLSLQNAQHKRETAEFQRELLTLRSRPNLDHALAELEERNNEMEELLRAKCTEIEENDDRVLEMLKEKKKLSAKVESLNRKVQNLQAKLSAAKASISAPPLPEPQSTPSNPQQPSAHKTPPSASIPLSRPRSATVTATSSIVQPITETPSEIARKTFTRIVSGPSSLPRPKTPERTKTITPVFKARTPERRMVPEPDPMPTAVVIGKKRAAPDDFEACENIPVQAFTAEGEDVENRTPRVRRVLNSLQSGFTPIRHQINRPTAPMPSPRRSAITSRSSPNLISDLTNSPHISVMPTSSAKPSSKRSWLGKIRGSSQDKPRSLFDRGEAS